MTTTWDQLTEQAHHLLTRPRRSDLTPAVTLVQSLHKQPPHHTRRHLRTPRLGHHRAARPRALRPPR